MGGIILRKNGSKLQFILDEDKSIFYDFNGDKFISYTGNVVKPSTLKTIFGKHRNVINKEQSDDKYVRLLELIERGCDCYNLGSLLQKLKQYEFTEKYISQGYNVNKGIDKNTHDKIEEVPKPIKKMFLENNFELDKITCLQNNNLHTIFDEMYKQLNKEQLSNTIDIWSFGGNMRTLNNLVLNHSYNPRAIVKYIAYIMNYEALDFHDTVEHLSHYVKMCSEMQSIHFEKYPKHLCTAHNISVRNFNNAKKKYDFDDFSRRINIKLEYKDNKYAIIYPKHYSEVQMEGANLNHCVGSYVNYIIKGRCDIVFLRKINEEDISLVTVEIKEGMITAYLGKGNRYVTDEEYLFLEKYAKKKGLILNNNRRI